MSRMPKKIYTLKSTKSSSYFEFPSNEINIIRRTLENNTHEVIEDTKLKRVTSWRKSETKFKKSLIFNILSFGIVHLISLFYPNLYIKLYCIPWQAKECDYFLVENIYGNLTLCRKIYKKNKNTNPETQIIKENILQLSETNINLEYNNIIKNVTYSFEYKSCLYEYNERNNEIIPIYINLSKLKNIDIYNYFSDGLSNQNLVKAFLDRYGKNEYKLNLNLIYQYFLKSQIPSLVIPVIIGLIEIAYLKNYIAMIIKIFVAIAIIIIQLVIIKLTIINKYNNEFTLDGKMHHVKVKRKYLLNKENQLYYNLNPDELLPGDIILLKTNEYVPCDCIIFNGECLVSESDLTGSLNIYKKIALKNNSYKFNYKYSNINILYHGMKIIKTFSKTDDGYISALCINTGSNTFKANLISNTLYLMERKKEYNKVYNLFGERKRIFIYIILTLILTVVIGVIMKSLFLSQQYINSELLKKNIYKIVIAILCKSFMAIFFIIQNILIFLSLYQINKLNLICFDKSRLIKSGKINTILLNKTETLCKTDFEIYSYNPVSYSINRPNNLIFKNYLRSQTKDLNKNIFDYYQNYLDKSETNINNFNIKYYDSKTKYPIVLFLECLLSCNSIEKYDIETFGNDIEIEMFKDLKWEIKQIEDSNYNSNNIQINYIREINLFKEIRNINNSRFSCHDYYYISKKVIDIFPNNYYKLSSVSSKTNQTNKENKNSEPKNDKQINLHRTKTIKKDSVTNLDFLELQLDIDKSYINSYKLRIYKKFVLNGTMESAAIVYNFITKELRFMMKGNPEDIINRCDKNSLPPDFEKVISINRRYGLIILICATKKIEINEYRESADLEYYMDDLTFVGFITLKNKLKDYVKNSIKELKKYNDNFVIVSGDNEYNCLSTGFSSDIIENKNIFLMDKESNNKISIMKIHSFKSNIENEKEKEEKASRINGIFRYSRVNTQISQEVPEKNDEKIRSVNTNNPINVKNNDNNFDLIFQEIDNDISQLEEILKKKDNIKRETTGKRRQNQNQVNEEFINGNSEYERMNNTKKTSTKRTLEKTNTDRCNNTRKKTNNTKYTITKNYTDEGKDEEDLNSKYLLFMEKYYYHDIFKDFADMKDCIFCMSGKIFSYLYNNKSNKGAKKFMDSIISKCKIFFDMSSIEKSLLVDYYREFPNNTVCVIGQCESDIDSIYSSDIGINLKNPKNLNTILCHYYSLKNDIICIKDIITNGQVFYENNVLLETISFICTLIMDGYLICNIFRNVAINQREENFLESEYFILATLSFLSKNKENIYINQNSKLIGFYYYLQLGISISFKYFSIILFFSLYEGYDSIANHEVDIEFLSYFFVICSELLICGILSLNFLSFYRESILSNYYFIIFLDFFLLYIIFLIFLSSSNFSMDILSITHFIRNEEVMDCYTDKIKLYLLLSIISDFIGTILFNWIVMKIFSIFIK